MRGSDVKNAGSVKMLLDNGAAAVYNDGGVL